MVSNTPSRNSVAGMTQEIREAREAWDAAVKDISNAEYARVEITPGWTLKDVVAHLGTYLDLNVRHIQWYKKRKKLASMRARNWYQFNKREAARNKKLSLAQAYKSFERNYARLLTELASLSDADLKATFASPWSVNETRPVRLSTVLRADVSRHLIEHARDVTRWRMSQDAQK